MQLQVKLEEAQQALLSFCTPLSSEVLPLLNTLGRVTAQDLFITCDIPPSPLAAMDGFALPKLDVVNSHCLVILRNLKNGDVPDFHLEPGHTAGVVTGGLLPAGTTAVIPQESVRIEGNRLFFTGTMLPGSNIREQCEDFQTGAVIARSGTVLRSGHLGVLAACGIHNVEVYTRPRVAIISMGREIVSYQITPEAGQVRDCNGPLLAAMVKCDGGNVTNIVTIGDDNLTEVRLRLEQLQQQANIILTIGGSASGRGDIAWEGIRSTGASPLFRGVQIKPGSHSSAASLGNRLLLNLSGNPAACAIGYQLLAAPVLRQLQGLSPDARRLTAICSNSYHKPTGIRRFIQGHAIGTTEGWRVMILPGQKSSMLHALMECNALIDIPAGSPPPALGDRVMVTLLNNLS